MTSINTTSSNVQVGDEIPRFERMTTFQHWNRYASVNYEFVDIHMDDEAGKAAGYPGAIGMGNLRTAYLHNMLRDWLGVDGDILRLAVQFRGPNLKNDWVICRGVVNRLYERDGRRMADLDIWTENQHGDKTTLGTATVALPPPR
jgi:acyl dehydratase